MTSAIPVLCSTESWHTAMTNEVENDSKPVPVRYSFKLISFHYPNSRLLSPF